MFEAPGPAVRAEGRDGGAEPGDAGGDLAFLLRAVPEFVPHYVTLVAAADDDPGDAAALEELAVFVSGLLEQPHQAGSCLGRCLSALEHLAASGPDGEELLVWSFLGSLSDADCDGLRPWMGPRTLVLLDELDD